MTHRLQNFFMTALFALVSLFWAQSFVSQNPTSGGYQLFGQADSGNFADNPLNALEKIFASPDIAPECCNATKGGGNPDFYVSPDGTVVPGTGVRFSDSQYADGILESGSSPAVPSGHYFGTETFPNASSAADAYQISPDWSDVTVQGEFNTLQLYDQSTGTWNIEIPTTNGNTTSIPEPFTNSYPEFGTGGYQQYITTPNTPLIYDNVTILPE